MESTLLLEYVCFIRMHALCTRGRTLNWQQTPPLVGLVVSCSQACPSALNSNSIVRRAMSFSGCALLQKHTLWSMYHRRCHLSSNSSPSVEFLDTTWLGMVWRERIRKVIFSSWKSKRPVRSGSRHHMRRPSNDCRERMLIGFAVAMELYRTVTGSLLSIFVPQDCSTAQDVASNRTLLCTTSDLARLDGPTSPLQVAAYSMNWVTLAAFLLLYVVETRRENFCVECSTSNPPCRTTTCCSPACCRRASPPPSPPGTPPPVAVTGPVRPACNVGITGAHLARRVTSGTIASLISFALLLVLKITSSRNVTRSSTGIRSAYLKEHSSFNIIDVDKQAEVQQMFVGERQNNSI